MQYGQRNSGDPLDTTIKPRLRGTEAKYSKQYKPITTKKSLN